MENFIYCNEEEIIQFLVAHGKGRDSHDTEFSEAVRLKRYYDKTLKRTHLIGIPISPEGFRQHNLGVLSKSEVLKGYRKEDTEVDILIIDADDSYASHRDSFRGKLFQMKRLTDRQFKGDFVSTVVEALRKIFEKGYEQSTYLSLYIPLNLAPQTHTPDWQLIVDFLQTQKVPFVEIILGPITNEKNEELLVEIFPKLRFLLV